VRRILPVRRGGGVVAAGVGHDSSPWVFEFAVFEPGRAKKRHSFHSCEFGRREALSTRSPKGRGSEHGVLCRAELHKRDGQKEPNGA